MNTTLPVRSIPERFDLTQWRLPSPTYSQCPFWFWNDVLSEAEIVRQMADFQCHGVDAFVIHPRIGLPDSFRWRGEEMFRFYRFAVEEAERRGMWAVLYDEGMYPSGSSAGEVVKANPSYRTRGLTCFPEGTEPPDDGLEKIPLATLTRQNGQKVVIYDQQVDSVIRGLHYLGPDPESGQREEEFPAADLLNPDSVRCFIDLVYGSFHRELGQHFGKTIRAIFTDEPHPLGRIRTPDARPGTTGILQHVSAYLGYDFLPHLPALWFDDEPDAARHQANYAEAISHRMSETYFRPLSEWCEQHGVALTGHPAEPDDFGHLRWFHLPGQDIVWRHIEPFQPSAIEGAPSTMAKAAASAAIRDGRPRNINEFAGAYGQELTFFEFRWLASWLLIRGCDLLMPHAFYYSIRGPRKNERPPEVGPHSPWWGEYRDWSLATRRLCWLNAEFTPVCHVAILGKRASLPWRAARICFENQIDFHYIEEADLASAIVDTREFTVGGGTYRVLVREEPTEAVILPGINLLDQIDDTLADKLAAYAPSAFLLDEPASDLRFRHLADKRGASVLMFFNEGAEPLTRRLSIQLSGDVFRLDEATAEVSPVSGDVEISLASGSWLVLLVEDTKSGPPPY